MSIFVWARLLLYFVQAFWFEREFIIDESVSWVVQSCCISMSPYQQHVIASAPHPILFRRASIRLPSDWLATEDSQKLGRSKMKDCLLSEFPQAELEMQKMQYVQCDSNLWKHAIQEIHGSNAHFENRRTFSELSRCCRFIMPSC